MTKPVSPSSSVHRDRMPVRKTPRFRSHRWLAALGWAIGAIGLIVVLVPSRFSQILSSYIPFAHLLAFPYLTGAGAMFLGVIIAVCAVRRSWRAALVAITWIALGLSLVLLPYGSSSRIHHSDTQGQRLINVVTYNSASSLTADDIAALMREVDPDIIVLPETSASNARRAIENAGFDGTVFSPDDDGFTDVYQGQIAPTSIVVSNELGSAHPDDGPATSFGTVALWFDDESLPRIIGVHTAPPIPGLMAAWRDDLERIADADLATSPVIVAGDFNATTRHGALAWDFNLIDSQAQCPGEQTGTWPATAPSLAQTPIDHVFISKSLNAQSCRTVRLDSSDHLAYATAIAIG